MTKSARKARAFNSMPKGAACVSCRLRKVRCTGELPACGACMRTAKYRRRQPTCVYAKDAGTARVEEYPATQRAASRIAKSAQPLDPLAVSDEEIEASGSYLPRPLESDLLPLHSEQFPSFLNLPYPHNPDYTPSFNPSLPLPLLALGDLHPLHAPFGAYTFPALPISPHYPPGPFELPTSPNSFGEKFDDQGTIMRRRGREGMRLDMPARRFSLKGIGTSAGLEGKGEQGWKQEIIGLQQAQEAVRKMMDLPYVPPASLPEFKNPGSDSSVLSNFQFRAQLLPSNPPSRTASPHLAPLTPRISTSQQSRPASSQSIFRPRLPSISNSLSGYIYPPVPIPSPSVDMLLSSLGQNSPWENRATEW